MHIDAVEVIRPKGAVLAALLIVQVKHEVIDDQLALPSKEIGQRQRACWALKCVVLVGTFPRQVTPLLAELVAQAGKLLLPGEELGARHEPFVSCHNAMLIHGWSSLYSTL